MHTVLVSRLVSFDPDLQPEVLQDIEKLKSAGFSVFQQVGDIVPVSSVVEPEASPDPGVASLVAAIQEKHGLSARGIAALAGVSSYSLHIWCKQGGRPSRASLERLLSLKRRSDRIEAGTSQLRDEARGAVRVAHRMRPTRRSRTTGEQKQEIIRLRSQGETVRDISRKVDVSKSSVIRILASGA
jgi:transcriptional regulator with XRE-family HTH domain